MKKSKYLIGRTLTFKGQNFLTLLTWKPSLQSNYYMLWSPKLNIIAAIMVKIPNGFSRRHESMSTYPICHSLGAAITVVNSAKAIQYNVKIALYTLTYWHGSRSLEKSLNFRGKSLKNPWIPFFLEKSLNFCAGLWIFFNFECSGLERVFYAFWLSKTEYKS